VSNKNYVEELISELELPERIFIQIRSYLDEKNRRYIGLDDPQRAALFWDTQLANERRISIPQSPDCKFAVIIPVYNEKKERVLDQIDSLRRQQGIGRELFEVIYVVNNPPVGNAAGYSEVLRRNAIVMGELSRIRDLNVFVIDKSSMGNEIEGCNVGKARNRGTAEACLRFFENNKNGVLIHTDADSVFDDVFYFKKLTSLLEEDSAIVGCAGSLVWKFDPDGGDAEIKNELYKKTRYLMLRSKWHVLSSFLNGAKRMTNGSYKIQFYGGHMISKSYAAAVIGGFFDGNALEDELFGLELVQYGLDRGLKVIYTGHRLHLVTALRESTRTEGSIGRLYDEIELGKSVFVPDPLAPETFLQFKERLTKIVFADKFELEDLSSLLKDPQGNLIVSEQIFDDLVELFRPMKVVDAAKMKDFAFMTNILYYSIYPKVAITEEYYDKMVKMVAGQPDGLELLDYIHFTTGNL